MGWDEPFEVFPVLQTERFNLRALRVSDAIDLFQFLSKDVVMTYYDLETLTQKQEAIELIEGLLYRYKIKKQIRWGITEKDNDRIIGTCGLHTLEEFHYKAEIGYELDPDYWNNGIMTEVVGRIVDYGFSIMGLNRIEAYYHSKNNGSRRVLEKNGFVYEGLLKSRFYEKGQFVDAVICAIIKEDT